MIAQIMMIVGGALALGSGVFGIARGKPITDKNGKEWSKGATIGIYAVAVIFGAATLAYALLGE